MSDSQHDPAQSTTPPAGANDTPPAGTPTGGAPTDSTQPPAGQPEITPEIQQLIDDAATRGSREANREARKLRDRLKAYEDAEEQRRQAEMTETERLAAERDAAKAEADRLAGEARAAKAQAALVAAATKAGFVDPTDAVVFLASSVETGDDGEVVNAEQLVAGLAEAKPQLVTPVPGTPGLGATNGAREDGSQPELTPQQQTEQLFAPRKAADVWTFRAS